MAFRAVVLAAALVAILAGILVTPSLGIADLGGGSFSSWLREIRSDDPDRGWSRLDEHTRATTYGNDRQRYLDEVMAADWSALDLEEPIRVWFDDGFARLEARLISAPATVPRFLFERGIVHGICDGGVPVAIGAYEDRRLLGGGGFGGGGVTGSQERCNAAFIGPWRDASSRHDTRESCPPAELTATLGPLRGRADRVEVSGGQAGVGIGTSLAVSPAPG